MCTNSTRKASAGRPPSTDPGGGTGSHRPGPRQPDRHSAPSIFERFRSEASTKLLPLQTIRNPRGFAESHVEKAGSPVRYETGMVTLLVFLRFWRPEPVSPPIRDSSSGVPRPAGSHLTMSAPRTAPSGTAGQHAGAVGRLDPATGRRVTFPRSGSSPTSCSAAREVWGAESGTDKLVVIRSVEPQTALFAGSEPARFEPQALLQIIFSGSGRFAPGLAGRGKVLPSRPSCAAGTRAPHPVGVFYERFPSSFISLRRAPPWRSPGIVPP